MARKHRLLWQLYPSYLLIALISLAAVSWYLATSFRKFYINQIAADLEIRARLLEDQIYGIFETDPVAIDSLCKSLGEKTSTRLTVVMPSGQVIGDSDENPSTMDNHSDRPELIEALNGKTGMSIRYSFTLKEEMMYVAIPLETKSRIDGALRVSIHLLSVNEAFGKLYSKIIAGFIMVLVFVAVVSFYISYRIKRPLRELKGGAETFAAGHLDQRIRIYGSAETAELAESMNDMAAQLSDRIRTVSRQQKEQEAILSSMIEGVLAVDNDQRIIIINRAAARLLGTETDSSRSRTIQETVRNIDIRRFILKTLSSDEPVEDEITIFYGNEITLRLRGTRLFDEAGEKSGALVVFSDITEIKRLENIRRDFVANVSHELKTPITAIKGFVETLLEGAAEDPKKRPEFLNIILSHTDRLNAIIEDLLKLSSIERDWESREIHFEKEPLKPVLQSAMDTCRAKASAKNIEMKLDCPDDLTARINPQLLEQAIINLVDNAINYSDSGNSIVIDTAISGNEIIINVRDKGWGIEKKHITRLFERFYRVDTARSLDLGGTGLGLAIVKHIAQAHGGYPSVESVPEKGSIFSLHLPSNL